MARVPARSRAPSLRTTLTAITIAVTVIALFVAAALVLLTTRMRDVTVELSDGIESIHIAEDAALVLLQYRRALDGYERARLGETLRSSLARERQYVTSVEEDEVYAEAARSVDRLVAMDRREPAFPAEEARASDLLERLIDINVAQAHDLEQRTLAWDRLADILGISAGVAIVALAVAGIWWLRSRAFRPVFDLADAMERFGRGELSVRAREEGPAELREMTHRFNEMAEGLAAQRDAQTAFIGSVAHDLRTPLGVLLMQVQIVAPDRPLPPEPAMRHVFEMVRRQVVRLDRMLRDLVTATRMDAGAFTLEIAECDLVTVVKNVADLFEGYSKQHSLELTLPSAPMVAHCDRLRVEQVVTNLVSNAIKYSPAGGRVAIDLHREDSEALLTVTDSGIGISPENQRHVFEPFSRLRSISGIPGAGLGLYVVRQIVEAHGGTIEVESAPGQGATFRVRLPTDRRRQTLDVQ